MFDKPLHRGSSSNMITKQTTRKMSNIKNNNIKNTSLKFPVPKAGNINTKRLTRNNIVYLILIPYKTNS